MPLESSRLRLVPLTPAHLLALIEGYSEFAQAFGLPAADGLRDFYVSDYLEEAWLTQLRELSQGAADPWVWGFAVVELAAQAVVGTVGFKGPPDETGVVEIAYGIVPSREGQGFATEAATAVIELAVTDSRVRWIQAHTQPEANASTHVLKKCRFEFVGEVTDPVDGQVWRWERPAVF
jgi:RimJ/RimL family protein N-acetyltransferase